MKTTIKALAIPLLLSSSSLVWAKDFLPAKTASTDSTLEVQAVASEQPYQQEVQEQFISAEDQLNEYLIQKGWAEGWDEKSKRLFVVVAESFNSEDPSYDDAFITKRSMFSTLTTMSAKAKIAEYMNTQMSAYDQFTAPGTDVHAELGERFNKLSRKMAKQQKVLIKLLREVDAAEADKLSGINWQDRAAATWDAIIKKLDEHYDTAMIEQKKLDKFNQAKARYESASLEMDELEKQAKALKGQVTGKMESSIATLAKAPILGTMVVAQAESWDEQEEEYQVASLVVWSPKLEKAAKAIMTGQPAELTPKKGKTVQQWLQTQELSTLVGSRSFIDASGDRWFVGAYGMPYEGASSTKRKNKNIAELMAKKEAVIAMFADVETQKQAQIALETRSAGDLSGKDNTQVATSFAEMTRQSIENKSISGLSKLFGKSTTHPLTGQKMYVVAYGISSGASQFAAQLNIKAQQNRDLVMSAPKAQKASQKALQDKARKINKTSSKSTINVADDDDF